MSRRLLFVTGTRADFGKLVPLAQACGTNRFNVTFFITGMHMMKKYGETRREVRGHVEFDFYEFVNQREGDSLELILAKTVLGLSDYLQEARPDLVVIHGDRIEALAASIVCATLGIRSAHIEGGELSGSIDESMRHCNSKLCSSHFVSSEAAARILIAIGEHRSNIYCIGSPELDVHAEPSGVSIKEVKNYYNIKFNDYGIVMFHPVTSERDSMRAQARSLFDALMTSQKSFVVIMPNNDPGTEHIFAAIESLPKHRFRIIPSMRFLYFSELMRHASAMIGNSSAGVREAPFLGVPSLNIGSRQNSRARSPSITDCSAFDYDAIAEFLSRSWGKKFPRDFSFGTGNAATSFAQILNESEFWVQPLQKSFVRYPTTEGPSTLCSI